MIHGVPLLISVFLAAGILALATAAPVFHRPQACRCRRAERGVTTARR